MRIRLILAIWACKLAIFASRLLGKQGSSMPGQLAMTICPQVLELLSAQVKKDIIVVCGTNGKQQPTTCFQPSYNQRDIMWFAMTMVPI